jgi:hypothetical protein
MKLNHGAHMGASTKVSATRERKRLTRVEVYMHIDTPILLQPTSGSLLQIISRGLGRLIATHILGQPNVRERLMTKTKQAIHNKKFNTRKTKNE